MLNDLTINDSRYYISNSATANDTKVITESYPKTVSDRKVKVTGNINKNMQQKLLSNRTLPVVVTAMEPMIDDMIETIGGASHTLSTTATKEVVTDVSCGSARVNWTPRNVIWTGRDFSTPGDTSLAVRSKPAPYPVMIGSTKIYPACGLSGRLKVRKK